MAFSINEFSAKLSQWNGLAKTNIFMVRISPPVGLINQSIQPDDLIFFCKTVEIPGISLGTADILNQGFGSTEKRPTILPNDVVSAVFMVDGGMNIVNFFHRWMQLIVNYNTDNLFSEDDGKLPYEFGYKDEYVGQMEVLVFNPQGDTIYTYEYKNVYPANLGAVSLSWEANSEVMSMPIGFNYDRFRFTGTVAGVGTIDTYSRSNGVQPYISALNSINSSATNVISQVQSIQELINRISNNLRF